MTHAGSALSLSPQEIRATCETAARVSLPAAGSGLTPVAVAMVEPIADVGGANLSPSASGAGKLIETSLRFALGAAQMGL